MAREERSCLQDDGVRAGGGDRRERACVAMLGLDFDQARLEAELAGPLGRRLALLARSPVKSDSDDCRARERLTSDLDALGGKLDLANENTRHIAART